MITSRPPLRTRGSKTLQRGRPRNGWRRERRYGVIATSSVALLLGALLSGYGVQSHMAREAAHAAALDLQSALATAAELQVGTILFVPQYGNVCRRRWIDNQSWTLRDGSEVVCDEAVAWNPNIPVLEYKVERRLGAIRNVFQPKAATKVE